MPYSLKKRAITWRSVDSSEKIAMARMGFYAQCTYIDHQMRLLIGTLREEGLLDSTYIVFTADHGDMLGDHRQWAKPPMFDPAARVPLIVVPPKDSPQAGSARADERLAALRDIMPTLLAACGIEIPETVEGLSLFGDETRDTVYCEHFEDDRALRMIRDQRYKLIWYPVGNRFQLFDMDEDPNELHDLSDDPHHADVAERLKASLAGELYGDDLEWMKGGEFVGLPDMPVEIPVDRGLIGQRGWRL